MHYWRSILIGGLLVSCVVSYAIFMYFWTKGSCPIGSFACLNQNICVLQKHICNSIFDCPNGEDEDLLLCNMSDYPNKCSCKSGYRLICTNLDFFQIPQNVSTQVTHLVLRNNKIRKINRESLSPLTNLHVLHLEGNQLTTLSPQIFKKQRKLLRLLLGYNNLTFIKEGSFDGLDELLWLFLQFNKIRKIELKSFKNLGSLEWIDLSHNKLIFEEEEQFPLLPNLLELFLGYNEIRTIKKTIFSNLLELELLALQYNFIAFIEEGAFEKLTNLKDLNLHGNRLKYLHPKYFGSMVPLKKLHLGNNPFRQFPSDLFDKLENLTSLSLEDINIENIDIKIFQSLKNLKVVYFKKYYYCTFAPRVPRCHPSSDGISSTRELLHKPILRYTTWITSIVTCLGNVLVIRSRYISKDENKILNLVIRNLAGSDLLMGIYLFIIAVHDLKYRDIYNSEAHGWMSSWSCTLSGMLAMVSSEVSVLLIVFMSSERFLSISVPYKHFSNMNIQTARIVMFVIWTLGIGIAIVPIIEFYSSTRFYGVTGLCFPLYIDEPFLIGWKYSATIVLGINSFGILIITSVYCIMFVSIWKTRNATSLPIRDYEFAIRFFFIVITDMSCWFPIIVTKILAVLGNEISPDLYSWLVVFVLPINSAVNPLLYTFTTLNYRTKITIPCVPKKRDGRFIEELDCFSPESSSNQTSRNAQNANSKFVANNF